MTMPATVRTARHYLRQALAAAGIDEADLEAVLLIEAASGLDRLRQMTDPDRPLDAAARDRLAHWLSERLSRKPLSQILGRTGFYGLPFFVTSDVLSPRPETEMLVDLILQALPPGEPAPWVADLGTGSGAIAVSLAVTRPDLQVVAIDRSEKALAVAQENGRRLGADIDWRLGDWTDPLRAEEHGRFAAIVSNPPYIPEADWRELAPEVRDHEPKEALVGGDDGLDPYRRLPGLVWPFLRPGGLLAVELGQGQAAAVQELFREAGYEQVTALPDWAGILRVVSGRKPV